MAHCCVRQEHGAPAAAWGSIPLKSAWSPRGWSVRIPESTFSGRMRGKICRRVRSNPLHRRPGARAGVGPRLGRIAKALAPDGAAFISLHNSRHPTSILSEPHYGIPGLSLLPFSEAAPLWARLRGDLGNTLDYDVYEWPSYADLETMARSVGFTASPWTDSEWMSAPFWQGYRDRRDALLRDVAAALRQLKLPAADAARLLATVRGYGGLRPGSRAL